jgi:YNFM family putative membrane transporter
MPASAEVPAPGGALTEPPSARAALAGFLVGATGMFACMYSTQAILPELARHFDRSEASAGLTVSVVVIAIAITGWLWGPLSDRIGRRRSLVLASSLVVLPTIGAAAAPTFETLLAARALQGVCMPGLMIVGIPYVMEEFGSSVGARVMGWYVAALITGGLVGRVGVAFLTDLWGWRVGLGALAVLPLLAAILLRRVLPPEQAGRARHTAPRAALVRTLTNPRLIAPTIAASAGIFGFVGTFTYIGFRLESPPFSYGQEVTGLVFLLWSLGFTAPLAGRLVERLGWRAVTLVAFAIEVPGVALTLVDHIAVFVVGLALVAVGGFGMAPATQLGVAQSSETDRGMASAVYYSTYYTGSGLAAFLPGIAWRHAGWEGVAATTGGTLVAAFLFVALAAGRLAPRQRPAQPAAAEGTTVP